MSDVTTNYRESDTFFAQNSFSVVVPVCTVDVRQAFQET